MSSATNTGDSLLLNDLVDFQQQALMLVGATRRNLAILSRTLDAPLYDSEEFAAAISALARSSRYAQVQILVKDTAPIIERGHRLARLAQRLSTKVSLRKLTLEPANTDMAFMLCDNSGLLYKNDDLVYRGLADKKAHAEVKRLREIFDYLWQHAEAEPRLQQLHL
jgi:hypothetical protein